MAVTNKDILREAYTFDDVLLKPGLSDILPSDVDIRSRITRSVALNIPILASAMDTVTESSMAIAMAQAGGIGVIHRNLEPDLQAAQVRQVKKFESGMVVNPVTIQPDATLDDALTLMHAESHLRHSGGRGRRQMRGRAGKLVGILTNRDVPLCHRQAAKSLGADDQGQSGHGTREREAGRSQAAPASTSHREASGGRRRLSLRRPDHSEGHREGGGPSRNACKDEQGRLRASPPPRLRSAKWATRAAKG